MVQSLQLNIIPFKVPVQEAAYAFYTAKQDAYCPKHKYDLNGEIEGLVDESKLYSKSVSQQNPSVTIKTRNGGRDIPIRHPRQTTQPRQGEPLVFVNRIK